jgi:hypothetical protein
VSPARIAVTGRQKLYVYLASQNAISSSARLRLSSANSRALCGVVKLCAIDAVCEISFQ